MAIPVEERRRRNREWMKQYYARVKDTADFKQRRKVVNRRYNTSAKGRACAKRYTSTPKGKVSRVKIATTFMNKLKATDRPRWRAIKAAYAKRRNRRKITAGLPPDMASLLIQWIESELKAGRRGRHIYS